MVRSFDQPVDARDCHGAHCRDDQPHTAPVLARRSGYLAAGLIACALSAEAETLRIATYNTELSRDGPGLLYRDIKRGKDPQVLAVLDIIARINPDILILQGIDWDYDGLAINALNERFHRPYPEIFARRPNRGMQTGLDMNGDGRAHGPADAQGFGRFSGQSGMALLSRFPVLGEHASDFSHLIWRDVPGATLPKHRDGSPYPSAQVLAVQRLSSTGHWAVPVVVGTEGVTVLMFHATAPVFDGPEDRNGLRNRDEIGLWSKVEVSETARAFPFVVAGDLNLDPSDGDGIRAALGGLLDSLRLVDPMPASAGGVIAAKAQAGSNVTHLGDPGLDTADWRDADGGPGNLRVDYVLPAKHLRILDAGVVWPDPGLDGDFAALVEAASRHRLVWVDVEF